MVGSLTTFSRFIYTSTVQVDGKCGAICRTEHRERHVPKSWLIFLATVDRRHHRPFLVSMRR